MGPSGTLDPPPLSSPLQAGTGSGFALLWLLAASTALGWLIQTLAIRLGVATGLDLASAASRYYAPPARIALWLAAEAAIVGADVQEVVGSAIALAALARLSLPAAVVASATLSFALLFLDAAGTRRLEALFAGFIAVMAASFGVLACKSGADVGALARGLVTPRVPPGQLGAAVACVGAAVMPHNVFLHSYLVRGPREGDEGEEGEGGAAARARGRPGSAARARSLRPRSVSIALFSLEAAAALTVAFAINVAVVTVFAAQGKGGGGGGGGGHLPAATGLADAGPFLAARFGPAAATIWALGLLASGQSSTMTGALAGQILWFGVWRVRAPTWARVAATRALSVAPTLALATAAAGDARALDALAQGLNVLQAGVLPLALAPLVRLAASPAVMGSFALGKGTTAVAIAGSVAVLACNAGVAAGAARAAAARGPGAAAAVGVAAVAYAGVVLYLAFWPAREPGAVSPRGSWGGGEREGAREPLLDGSPPA